jgi:hypothetical protein
MNFVTKTAVLNTTAETAQTLPEPATLVLSVVQHINGTTTDDASNTVYTVTSEAPSAADQVQFLGSPSTPSAQLTFDAALTAGNTLYVTYVAVGELPAAM